MNNSDKVFDVVTSHPGLTAIEIAMQIFGPNARQQQVNALLVALCEKNVIWRDASRPYRYFSGQSIPKGKPAGTVMPGNKIFPPGPPIATIAALQMAIGNNPLFVIPCCKTKQANGNAVPPPPLYMMANPAMLNGRLQALQHAQGTINPSGVEFNIPHPTPALYRPAWERYEGNFYRVPGVQRLLQQPNNIMIMSALYGLVLSQDLIQNYDLKMKTVRGIWLPILPAMLANEANVRQATAIVGFLPSDRHNGSYAGVFRGLQAIARPPTYLVSTAGRGASFVLRGLAYALLHFAGGAVLPPQYRYNIDVV
jgi:hypothetical protein